MKADNTDNTLILTDSGAYINFADLGHYLPIWGTTGCGKTACSLSYGRRGKNRGKYNRSKMPKGFLR